VNNPASLLRSLYLTEVAEMIKPSPNPSIADCNINRGKRKINGDGKVTEAGFDEQYIEIASNRTKSWITKVRKKLGLKEELSEESKLWKITQHLIEVR
jgi:hypothetical protein